MDELTSMDASGRPQEASPDLPSEKIDEIYRIEIAPSLLKEEASRVAAARSAKRRLRWGLLCGALIVGGIMYRSQSFGSIFIVLFAASWVGLIIYVITNDALADVRKRSKKDIMAPIARALGLNYKPFASRPPAVSNFLKWGLVPPYSSSTFEDIFQGDHANVPICFYKAELSARENDGETRAFSGIYIQITLPAPAAGTITISRAPGWFTAMAGDHEEYMLADPKSVRAAAEGDLGKIDLTSAKAHETFEIGAENPISGMPAPSLLDVLLKLEAGLDGKRLRCVVEGENMWIVVETGSLFDIGSMFEPLPDPARVRRIADQISPVLALAKFIAAEPLITSAQP
jgi:hypothetical protein